MHYVILGYDGNDVEAAQRRAKARQEHLDLADEMIDKGRAHYGAAIMNDTGLPIGSLIVLEFDSPSELQEYLKREPFATQGVWTKIEVLPLRQGARYRGANFSARRRLAMGPKPMP